MNVKKQNARRDKSVGGCNSCMNYDFSCIKDFKNNSNNYVAPVDDVNLAQLPPASEDQNPCRMFDRMLYMYLLHVRSVRAQSAMGFLSLNTVEGLSVYSYLFIACRQWESNLDVMDISLIK